MLPFFHLFPLLASACALAFLLLVVAPSLRTALSSSFGVAAPTRGDSSFGACLFTRVPPRLACGAARAVPIGALLASVFFLSGLSMAATPPPGSRAYSWGGNAVGQLGTGNTTSSSIPVTVDTSGASALNGKTVTQLAAGSGHSLGLCSDGTLVAWGWNSQGQLGTGSTTSSNVPVLVSTSGASALNGKTVTQVAAGVSHSLALCSDGTVVAWGWNNQGQLGTGSTTNSSIPVAVDTSSASALNGKTVVQVAAGYYHSFALCSDGTLVAWGSNDSGQLGNGTGGDGVLSSFPVTVDTSSASALNGKTVSQVAAGPFHNLALCSDGTLVAWGWNNQGQLGTENTMNSSVPVLVSTSGISALNGKTVTQAAAAGNHSLALCSDGTVVAWGRNSNGQLGTGNTTQSSVPVLVSTSGSSALNGKTVTQVTASQSHCVALCSDGTVVAWGHNDGGQLGTGSTTDSSVPVAVTTSGASALNGKKVVRLMLGMVSNHTLVIAAPANSAPVVAKNAGLRVAQNAAQTPITNTLLKAADADGDTLTYTLAAVPSQGTLKINGLALVAGDVFTQADIDAGSLSFTPGANARIGSDKFTFSVSDGHGGSVNGTFLIYLSAPAPATGSLVYSWGRNDYGQLGNNRRSQSTVPVAVFTSGVLNGKTVVQVATGGYHSLALCSDGTLVAWGENGFGQLGNGTSGEGVFSSVPILVSTSGASALNGKTVVQIAAGQYHSLALCSDGTVVAWGYNNRHGQLGTGTTTDSAVPVLVTTSGALNGKSVVQVTAGQLHSVVLCSDGTLVAWGRNSSGELGNGNKTDSNVPVAVVTSGDSALNGKTVIQVATGSNHSLALCSDGTPVTWGLNHRGQLGTGNVNESTDPVLVSTDGALNGKTVSQVAAGAFHSLVLCSDGTPIAWGGNEVGQLGTGKPAGSIVPIAVVTSGALSGKTVVQVATGYNHCLALCSDGAFVAWGENTSGQLGTGNTTTSRVPVSVGDSGALRHATVVQLSLGNQNLHTSVIATPGRNQAPALVTNLRLRVAENAAQTPIPNTLLKTTDADEDTLTYTLEAVPSQGTLKRNGVALAVGGTFTQADIDGELLTFTPKAGAVRGGDGFTFSVADGYGGTISATTFALTITEAGSLIVTTGGDDSTTLDGLTSLREAVTFANSNDNGNTTDAVTFDPTVFSSAQTITLTQGELRLTSNVSITGLTSASSGVNLITINGNNQSRVFGVSSGICSLTNLILTGGNCNDSVDGNFGGAIFVDEPATLTVRDCALVGNTAPRFGYGGAIYSYGTLLVERCLLSGNIGANGGAIYSNTLDATPSNTPTAYTEIRNSTFVGNTATAAGGAVYNLNGLTILDSCTIVGNTAAQGGGALYSYNNGTTRTQVRNSIIVGSLQDGGSADSDVESSFTDQPFQSLGHNFVGTGTAAGDFSAMGDATGRTLANSGLDVENGAPRLAFNGGATQTVALVSSGAADAGSTDLDVDQRGMTRPKGVADDIGAFESLNTAPSISTVAISPGNPKTNDTLTATPSTSNPAGSSDPDGNTLSFSYQWFKNGSVINAQTSSTLNLALVGNGDKGDQITVTATAKDPFGATSAPATSASVTIVNSTPVLVGKTYKGLENQKLSDLVAASDADQDALTYSVQSTTRNGTLALQGNGAFTYTPRTNWNGSDTFSVRVVDGSGATTTATFTLNIAPVNGVPVAVADVVRGMEDVALSIPASTLLFNDQTGDNRGEGDTLRIIKVVGQSGFPGTLTFDISKQTIVFTPRLNWNGTTTFTYTIQDSGRATATAQVTLQIAPVNDAPVALPTKMTVISGTLGEIQLAGTDVEGDVLAFALSGRPTNGGAQVLKVGDKWLLRYQSKLGFNGTDTLTFIARDGKLNSAPATVTLTVNANNAPLLLGVFPNRGTFPSGSTVVFQQKVRDIDGTTHLDATALLIGNSPTVANARAAATLWFDAQSNRFTLTQDDGTATFAPVALGQTLENSQVKVTLGAGDVRRESNGILTLRWNVTFKPGFVGTKSLWSRAEDMGNLSAGFTKSGDITLAAPTKQAPLSSSAPNS